MKHVMIIGMTALVVATCADRAIAQVPIGGPGLPQQYRPAYSPYLNLLRSGSSPAVNYYGLVRPQLNFINSIGMLQQQVSSDQQEISGLQFGNLPTTGHPVQFLNLKGYFQSTQGGADASRYVGNQALLNQVQSGVQGQSPLNQQGILGINSGVPRR
jgi:hypothetical protein